MSLLINLFRAMRPKQWTKNVIVYAGIVFDGQLFVLDSFLRVTLSFVVLCMVASTIYLINDLVDIEADKLHPTKRFRPLASGVLPREAAIAAAILLPVVSILVALSYNLYFTLIVIIYFVTHVLYSFWLKRVVLIDVMAVTSGYVLRVLAGVVVVSVANFSPWLYACTGLLALFLAIGKRRQELVMLADRAQDIRATYQEYNLPLLDEMLRVVTTSTFVAYLLYTVEADTIRVADTSLALITVPFVLYALFRYLYLIHTKGEGGAPDEVLLTDRPLLASILLWGLTFVVIIYLPILT